MSLKAFHIIFITLSAVLSSLLAIWGFRSEHLLLGLTGLVLLIFLIPYGLWFRKKMSRFPFFLLPCAVCFGDPNSPLVHGAKMGVLTLIVVIGGVLAAILYTACVWIKRSPRD